MNGMNGALDELIPAAGERQVNYELRNVVGPIREIAISRVPPPLHPLALHLNGMYLLLTRFFPRVGGRRELRDIQRTPKRCTRHLALIDPTSKLLCLRTGSLALDRQWAANMRFPYVLLPRSSQKPFQILVQMLIPTQVPRLLDHLPSSFSH